MTPGISPLEAQWLGESFSIWPMAGRFVPSIARVFYRPEGEGLSFRVEITAAHCNGFEIAHGGFISTMADIWLGYNVAHVLPELARFTTVSLNVDFLKSVRAGQWIESKIDRIKIGSRLHHAAGVILADAVPIASMRAVFAAIDPRSNASPAVQTPGEIL